MAKCFSWQKKTHIFPNSTLKGGMITRLFFSPQIGGEADRSGPHVSFHLNQSLVEQPGQNQLAGVQDQQGQQGGKGGKSKLKDRFFGLIFGGKGKGGKQGGAKGKAGEK